MWCVNAGHGRREIVQAVASQLETMEYAPPFQMGHAAGFALANELVKISPAPLKHVFFTFFFSSRGRHTRSLCDWSSDVCSSDLASITRRESAWHSARAMA